MKNKFLSALAMGVLVVGLGGVAQAVPEFQIGIEGGYYVGGSEETVTIDSDIFTFYALSTSVDHNPYNIALSLIPTTTVPVGDIVVTKSNGVDYFAITDWLYGTPQYLPTHDVFPTLYKEIEFSYDESSKAKVYNTEDSPDGWITYDGTGDFLYSAAFDVNMSSIAEDYTLHIDFYSYSGLTGKKIVNAPFSHDGQGGGDC